VALAFGRLRPPRLDRLVATPSFLAKLSRLPVARTFARRDGAAIFGLMQGFVAAQVLAGLVELRLLRRLLDAPSRPAQLALATGLPEARLEVLLRAGAALGLLKLRRDGHYRLARRGAAILGVPGLEAMIAHHRAFYADMADPAALLRGDDPTHLARFWPYVLGGGTGVGADDAQRYSDLMAQSQALVAQEVLPQLPLDGVRRLMDVGGGTGTFLAEALARHPRLTATLVDLPEVVAAAVPRLARAGVAHRVTPVGLNFRESPLPEGADAISLVRVLYDHADETVLRLLARCRDALPAGGRLIVAEAMSGGDRPDPVTDVYYAFYTMAMGTGRVRSAARIAAMCRDAGFTAMRTPRPARPWVASVLTCVKES
jgi:demethylspheroidene O-methyltransferase